MPDRFEPMLKIVCLALAVLLLWQVVLRALHSDPLGHASIPPLPTLSVQTEAKAKDAPTNSVAKENVAATNTASVPAVTTNAPTNSVAKGKTGDTNAITQAKPPKHGRKSGPHMGGPSQAANLPPPIQSRVDRIKESEILGPFIRPLPLALLGIADDDAFLRAPNGQTGLIKEGDELGGVKLLRIGINRVLVEEDGEKKELTLFEGFGSDSLLPKVTNNPTNATITPNQKENP